MPFVIEFEIVAVTGTIRLYIGANNNFIGINQTGKYHAEVTSTGISISRNGIALTPIAAPSSPLNIGWSSHNTSNKGIIKNFIICLI